MIAQSLLGAARCDTAKARKFGRPDVVPLAFARHLPKQHLHSTVPRHLGKLIDRGDHHRRQSSVNLLVHNDDAKNAADCDKDPRSIAEEDRDYYPRIRAFAQLQLSEREIKEWME